VSGELKKAIDILIHENGKRYLITGIKLQRENLPKKKKKKL
jgi:hypothetical protein